METSQQYCLRWNNHEENLRATMAEQFQNQIFTDVILSVDDSHTVHCHKMILAASSSYFRTIFANFPCNDTIIVLNDVKYKEIIAILEYMYKGEINVPGSDLPALFKVAEALEIKGLVGGNKEFPVLPTAQPEIGSRGVVRTAESRENVEAVEEHSWTPHSTSSPRYPNGVSPNGGEITARKISQAPWPFSLGFPVEGHDPIAVAAALQSSLSARYSTLLGLPYDNDAEAVPRRRRKRKMSSSGIKMNPGEPILRTALKQGHNDNPHGMPMLHNLHRHDTHYRSTSNGSANNESDDKHSSVDAFNSHPAHSPYESEASMIDEDDNKLSRTSFSRDDNSGNASFDSAQKIATAKRYKRYTHTDIAGAIAAVLKSGMSANKAAALFRVPSRTLYDKISRVRRSGDLSNCGSLTPKREHNASNSGACFPYGIGGNATGSIYGNYSEGENDNGSVMTDNPATLMETTFAESRDDSIKREVKMEIGRNSPSPQLPVNRRSSPIKEPDNEAEDLSMSRKSEVRVIMPPSIAIKEAI